MKYCLHKTLSTIFMCLFVLVACSPNPPPSPPESPPPPSPSPTPTKPPIKVQYAPPDVQFENVVLEKRDDQIYLTATIRNNGPVTAQFDGRCRWECPPGGRAVSGGTSFAQSELLHVSDAVRSYGRAVYNMCDLPLPFELNCSMDVQSWVDGDKGSQVKTVTWSQQMQIPF